MAPLSANRLPAASGRGLARSRLLRFLVVGAGANLLLLVLTYVLLRSGVPALLAGALGYAVAFGAAYLAQRDWTFGGAHGDGSPLPRYALAQVACAAASSLVGHLCAGVLAMAPASTSVAVTATAGAMSYLISSRWVFAPR